MSAVRKCDKCGDIFSENDDGWDTGTMQKKVRNEMGQLVPVVITLDFCATCSVMPVPERQDVPPSIMRAIRTAVKKEKEL